jgi:hypothetical protein
MDITLHEESYGQKSLKTEIVNAFHSESIKVHGDTIKNLMAYSKALAVNQYQSLGQQENNLN